MDDKTREDILASAMLHSIRESYPDEFVDPYFDMDSIEKSKFIMELTRMLASREKEYQEEQQRNAGIKSRLDAMVQVQLETSNRIIELMKELREERAGRKRAEDTISELREEIQLLRKDKYAHKSQSSKRRKNDSGHDGPDRQQQKDDFDGTQPFGGQD